MYRTANPLFLTCETPTHAGSGSELGVVDLPIQREKHTGFPKMEGSTLKGSFREAIERRVGRQEVAKFASWNAPDTKIQRIFGYDDGSLDTAQKEALKQCFTDKKNQLNNEFSGCVGFADARLLLFPVKSMKGVFAWITCPQVLQQFALDMELAGVEGIAIPKGAGLVPETSNLTLPGKDGLNVVLEEYAFGIRADKDTSQFCEWLSEHVFQASQGFSQQKVKHDVVVLPNDDFRDFVNLSTEVITRTKINSDTGTVEQGQLFTEEYLPAESVLYTLALVAPEFSKQTDKMKEAEVLNFLKENLPGVMQIGGNATLGKGIVRTRLMNMATAKKAEKGAAKQ
ncbi:type III-B CRISPR module RAMP protein Cmr4 [uncultured Microscilla sp.]|uniref:type III-B CRISPR module RAMP protein Cmr4 n=1 Tax=uncultured Microscilla sp. TaxID=432653 RepID=UPI00261668F4|nr:type III-B CRISPR module RAMP protein Cmr4 [uncultured Microscilla sp.]